jgi:hypothetical protein
LDLVRKVSYTTCVLPFASEATAAKHQSQELLDALKPKAVIAIEKLGPNAAGVTHTATGIAFGSDRAQIEH